MKKRQLLFVILAVLLALSVVLLAACNNHDCAKDGHDYGDDGKCKYCGEAKPDEHDCDKDGHKIGADNKCEYCGLEAAVSFGDTIMQQLFEGMNTNLRNQKDILTEPISLPAITGVFGDDGDYCEAVIKWTTEGADTISMGARNADDYCVLQCPEVRETNTQFTISGSLTDENGKPFINKEGKPYSVSRSFTLLSADSLKAAVNGFYEAAVKNPVVDKPYKWAALAQYQVLYFAGKTQSDKTTYRYKTTTNYAEATDVYLESTEGGYLVYFMDGTTKTYVDLHAYSGQSNSGTTGFVTDTTKLEGVYTVHSTGAMVAKGAGDTSKGYYLGVREQYYPNISAINYYLDSETGSHGWKTYEHPLFLLDEEYKMPAQPELTAEQILDKAYSLVDGEEMSGQWSLTGTVIDKTGANDYATVTIKVGERTILGYGMYIYNNEVRPGAEITLTGVIKNYQETVEFDKYCKYHLEKESPYADLEAVEAELRKTYASTLLDWGISFKVEDTIKYKDVEFPLEWTLSCAEDNVKLEGNNVTVVKGAKEVEYRLEAVITDPDYPTQKRTVTLVGHVPVAE